MLANPSEMRNRIKGAYQPSHPQSNLRSLEPVSFSCYHSEQADAFINYKCKKGECGTCDVMIDGKWVHTCQTKVPSLAKGESFNVFIRAVS